MDIKLAGELADEGIFRIFHFPAGALSSIVVAEQVKHAVDDVAH